VPAGGGQSHHDESECGRRGTIGVFASLLQYLFFLPCMLLTNCQSQQQNINVTTTPATQSLSIINQIKSDKQEALTT
jgi:hypothetical protein